MDRVISAPYKRSAIREHLSVHFSTLERDFLNNLHHQWVLTSILAAAAAEVEVVVVEEEVVEAVAVSVAEAGKSVGISLHQKTLRIPSNCFIHQVLNSMFILASSSRFSCPLYVIAFFLTASQCR